MMLSASARNLYEDLSADGRPRSVRAAEIFRALAPDREADIKHYENLYARGLLD
jgi:hypothetical protein